MWISYWIFMDNVDELGLAAQRKHSFEIRAFGRGVAAKSVSHHHRHPAC
jgi:hypothetical protein